ncbi:nitrite reductase [Natronococcus sp.]|uniref:nitrite reductase n=1 Tax=Natronococcus sp. TaxID=35747 RepID=UPI003A4E50DC
MTVNTHGRRQFLAVASASGTVLVAGCFGESASDEEESDADAEAEENGDNDDEDGLPEPEPVDVDRIAADPTDVPDPVDWDEPREHEITLESIEAVAEVEDGLTLRYMTYEGQIPGPMIRVREGDTIDLTFDVPEDENVDAHNVDFHAVYGPGGAAADTTLAPGDDVANVRFQLTYPGVHIYHCAVPNMDHSYDFDAAADESPTYVALNGEYLAFTDDGAYGPVEAEVGETARIYYANGGPNLASSWHAIGNVWSRYYRDGDLTSAPDENVETAMVGPGTTTAAEVEFPVPGPVSLVDHALSRVVHRGSLGQIAVEGDENTDVYDGDP